MSKKRKKEKKRAPYSIHSEGNFLLIKNQISQKEHARRLERVRQERPLLLTSLEKRIDLLIKRINHYNKVDLLAAFAVLLLNEKQTQANTDTNVAELNLEYTLSIALSSANHAGGPTPTAENVMPIAAEMEKIRQGFVHYYLSEGAMPQLSPIESKLRFDVIISTLSIRGEAYEIHWEEVFTELFGMHDTIVQQQFGFTFADILATFKYIENSLSRNQEKLFIIHRQFVNWIEQQNPDEILAKYGQVTPQYAFRRETGLSLLTPPEQYQFNPKTMSESQKSVVKALSLTFGDNQDFFHPDRKAFPLNDTLLAIKPIVYDGRGNYYFFSTLMAHRNLFTMGEALLKQASKTYYEKTYLGKGFISRSSYVERKAIESLIQIITNGKSYVNLKYDVPNEKGAPGSIKEVELDGLIVSQSTLYLIEIKSGGFSNAARRGAIKQLSSDVKKLFGDAVDQVNRAEEYIASQDKPIFRLDNGDQVVVDKTKHILKIVVSLSSIFGLTTQLEMLRELSLLADQQRFPWIITLFDLLVFADLFQANETSFLAYLNWRLPLYEKGNFSAMDELNLLGLFYSEHRDTIHEQLATGRTLQLGSFTAPIDAYYTSIYLGQKAERPFLPKLN